MTDHTNPYAPPIEAGPTKPAPRTLVVFTAKQIGLAALFGGVLGAAYLCIENHRAEHALPRIWIVAAGSLILLGAVMFTSAPNALYPLLIAAAYYQYARLNEVRYQRERREGSLSLRDNWQVVVVTVASLLFSVAFAVAADLLVTGDVQLFSPPVDR